jgi:hypothetical protein
MNQQYHQHTDAHRFNIYSLSYESSIKAENGRTKCVTFAYFKTRMSTPTASKRNTLLKLQHSFNNTVYLQNDTNIFHYLRLTTSRASWTFLLHLGHPVDICSVPEFFLLLVHLVQALLAGAHPRFHTAGALMH